MFLGNLSHPPNVRAVRDFYRQVFPLIVERRPRVRWYVVGAEPAAEVRALAADPRVVVTGWVEDPRDSFERAAVVISPLRSGSGW